MKTLTLLTLLFLSAGVQAQNAATWSFPGGSASATSMGSNIVASAFSAGPGLDGLGASGSDFFGYTGWPTGMTPDPDDYLQFTISGASGYYLVLNTITLNVRRSTTGTSSGSGPQSWSLRSSLDGYTTDLVTGSLTLSYQTVAVTLPAAFQSIPSTVTFRMYGFNATTTTGGSSRLVTNSVKITGQSFAGTLAAQSIELAAKPAGSAVDLEWQALGFEAGTTFSLERSTDGTDFRAISRLDMGNGASGSNTGGTLTAVDNDAPTGRLFYRIVAQSPDGSSYISPIATVNMLGESAAKAPIRAVSAAGGSVRAMLSLSESGSYQLSIRSIDGKALYQQSVVGQTGETTTDLAFGMQPHGIYVLTLMGNGVVVSREFLY